MMILIIIPCYNESKSIVSVVESLRGKYDYIVINDGSTDNTLDILKKHNINHIDLKNNIGISGAIQTGIKYAKLKNYDIVIQFDGDGQHDASYIDEIIRPIETGEANLVVGSRFMKEDENFKSTFMRRFGISILSYTFKFMTKTVLKDITSGFRAMDRRLIYYFADNYPLEYPEPITNLEATLCDFKIKEIPVKMNERSFGKSSISSLKSAYYMMNVMLLFLVKYIFRGRNRWS